MNKIDKLPDEYIDASIVTTLLWDKIGEIIEWQNEMVDLMLNTSSVIHTLDGRLSQLEANTPEEIFPKFSKDFDYIELTSRQAFHLRSLLLDYQDGGKTLKVFVEKDNGKRD